ncbi:MAG: hypothetical protein ACYSWZ_04525 [Planctomycetota bacterium]
MTKRRQEFDKEFSQFAIQEKGVLWYSLLLIPPDQHTLSWEYAKGGTGGLSWIVPGLTISGWNWSSRGPDNNLIINQKIREN